MLSKLRNIIVILALVISLCLNIAIVTVQSVATGVSAMVSAVAGASAVLPELRSVIYKGERKTVAEVVKSTTKRIARRTAFDATRNVSSTFGEAVPAIGIGVIAGVSAWELKDSCDTMRDLHELDVALDPSMANDAAATEVCGLKVPTKEEIWAKVKASPGEAWEMAKAMVPDLPDMPALSLPEMPEIDWKFWD